MPKAKSICKLSSSLLIFLPLSLSLSLSLSTHIEHGPSLGVLEPSFEAQPLLLLEFGERRDELILCKIDEKISPAPLEESRPDPQRGARAGDDLVEGACQEVREDCQRGRWGQAARHGALFFPLARPPSKRSEDENHSFRPAKKTVNPMASQLPCILEPRELFRALTT